MATYIKTMKDINGNTVLPKTNIRAVYDDSGNRLDGILNGSQLPSFTPNLSLSDTIPMHQNGSNVKIRLDDFLVQAGAPYGGIVSKGSNANGSYISFADGTLIQSGLKYIDTVHGRNIVQSNITFPATFSNEDYSISMMQVSAHGDKAFSLLVFGGTGYARQRTWMDFYIGSTSGVWGIVAGLGVSFIAIGRWK